MMNITELNREMNMPINMLCDAIMLPRATYYRHINKDSTEITAINRSPKNALSDAENQAVLDLLHSERFVDKTPYEVFYTLIDEGQRYCSPRTMYRLLASHNETTDRRHPRNHRNAVKPELIATGPNEVWSWDITKLLCTQRLQYFHLYVIMDIFSRYVVGWLIADRESKIIARQFIKKTAFKQGIQPGQLTLHADNGTSMKSYTVEQLLDHLGVTKTHNRPYTSDDNPFSESQFKTLKYHPEFPGRFETIKKAEAFCQEFFTWYNQKHYHSGIAWLTPKSVHYGQGREILEKRHKVMMEAFEAHPERFNHKGPQLKALPAAVYINPPQTVAMGALQQEVIVA
jgi:putative transposase